MVMKIHTGIYYFDFVSLHVSVLTSNPCDAPKNCRTVCVVIYSVFHKKYIVCVYGTCVYVLIIVKFKYVIFFVKTKSNSWRTILEILFICISLLWFCLL